MILKFNLFGNNIEPACQYCENGKSSKDLKTVICKKRGSVEPSFSCRSYIYAPLKRIPKKPVALPSYTNQDFEL